MQVRYLATLKVLARENGTPDHFIHPQRAGAPRRLPHPRRLPQPQDHRRPPAHGVLLLALRRQDLPHLTQPPLPPQDPLRLRRHPREQGALLHLGGANRKLLRACYTRKEHT